MILYFSGTGNSRQVAMTLSGILGDKAMEMTPDMRHGKRIPTTDNRVIWVFPIYSWGVPPYVDEVIKGSGISNGNATLTHHAVVTCGDDCGLADRMWRKAIRSRGWTDGTVQSVRMPNNYVAMKGFDVDSKELEAEKLAAFPVRIAHAADTIVKSELNGDKTTDIVHGSYAWIKTRVIYPWFIRHAMNPGRFSVTDSCISCGKCARTCPLGNISMDGENGGSRPKWGNDCAGCLGCYHICPTHAIDYANATRGKGQYFNPDQKR